MTSPGQGVAGDRAVVVASSVTKWFLKRRSLSEVAAAPFRRPERVHSLDDVSLTVDRGEFFGLLGPNGAGKTTLLRIVSTLLTADEGDIWVDGFHTESDAAQVRRLVSPVMANERSLYWRLTARDNLDLFAVLRGLEASDRRARVREALEVVGLDDTGEKMVGQFSSGMMQRLLIARALLADPPPRVLILDEPTRSLDPVSARDLRRFLREELVRRRECAVMIATHSTEEAFDLCDRVAILSGGRIVASGDPNTLARELAPDRYVVWTNQPAHPVFGALRADGSVFRSRPSASGRTPVVIEIAGGEEAAAALVRRAVVEGCDVAAFEKMPLSLADLIETANRRVQAPA
ncbi:MAG: ABC transporter ATP-binding protein [Gemmatimonadota bacterium]